MSERGLDVRKSIHIVRRYRKPFIGISVLGFLVGIAYGVLVPPVQSSQALVVFPSVPSSIATEKYIATSDPVLESALHGISPPMSLAALHSSVSVSSLTTTVVSITGSARSATTAEEIANAVAKSFAAYRSSKQSPVPPMAVNILQPASVSTGRSYVMQFIIYGIIGLLSGALVGFIAVLAIGRNDRRLRERDEIADSIGVPVMLSVPVAHPAEATEWRRLLEEYEPAAVDAWQLRKVLAQLRVTDLSLANARDTGTSITVLALSSDPGGLALGPQLASFAAARGIPTTLVVSGQQGDQDAGTAATLRAACAVPLPGSPAEHRRPLELVDDVHLDPGMIRRSALVIAVTLVNCRNWQIRGGLRTDTTVLGVSAGVATADQLARAATAAAAGGHDIAGILVADPDPADRTTGRLPQMIRPTQLSLPSRLNGTQTEIRQ